MIFFKSDSKAPSEEKQGGLNLSGDLGFSSTPSDSFSMFPGILAILRMGILAEAHGCPRRLSMRHAITPRRPGVSRVGQQVPTKGIPLTSDPSPILGKLSLGLSAFLHHPSSPRSLLRAQVFRKHSQ